MIFIKILKNTIQIRNRKISIVFDDMTADMLGNKNVNPIVKHFYCFYYTTLFCCAENIRPNSTYHFVLKVLSK